MKKRDCILICVLLAVSVISVLLFWPGDKADRAYIYVGDSLYGIYDLSDDGIIRIANDNGMVNEIEISDGSIFMRSANCPDKLCVKSGRISLDGESICCAPAGILIVVRSETGGEYDAVTK